MNIKSISRLAIAASISGVLLSGCSSPATKVENAKEEVADASKELSIANNNLDEANLAYKADIENYRQATADKIAANEKSIAEFNTRVDLQKKEAKAEYKMKIAELEKKNSDMKKKMDEYKEDGKDNWEKFKTEFSHDMDELGNAFRDLTIKNTK